MFEGSSIYIFLIDNIESIELNNKLSISELWYLNNIATNPKAKINVCSPPNSACFPEYDESSLGVGRMNAAGITCSFSLLNNENNNRTPYVLSARHCIASNPQIANLTQADKDKLNTASFEMPFKFLNCNGTGGTIVRYQSTGATYLDSQWPLDYLFFRINGTLPLGLNYLGWNRNIGTPYSCIGIHHPNGDQQKISFGNASANPTDITKVKVTWSNGCTAPGSSGSSLLNSGKVVGDLSYGVFGVDRYTIFGNTWQHSNGGTKAYLSPTQNWTWNCFEHRKNL